MNTAFPIPCRLAESESPRPIRPVFLAVLLFSCLTGCETAPQPVAGPPRSDFQRQVSAFLDDYLATSQSPDHAPSYLALLHRHGLQMDPGLRAEISRATQASPVGLGFDPIVNAQDIPPRLEVVDVVAVDGALEVRIANFPGQTARNYSHAMRFTHRDGRWVWFDSVYLYPGDGVTLTQLCRQVANP